MGKIKYDELLVTSLGDFGKYQRIQFFLVLIPCIFVSMQALSWTFTGAVLDYRCRYPGENDTHPPFDDIFNHFTNASEVKKIDAGDFQCKRYPGMSVLGELAGGNKSAFGKPSEKCEAWKYDHSEITNSAFNRFNIVCDQFWYRAMVQSVYYIGQAAGSLFFGFLGDRYGRKVAFIIAIIIQAFSGTLMAFVPWIWAFAFFRMMVGFCHPGVFVISVVIGMELVGPTKRFIGGIATGIFFAIGQIMLAGLAYGIRDYQHLQLAISIPYFLFIAYWWIVPESARWLISQGRREDADKILRKAATMNGRHLPEDWWDNLDRGNGSDEKRDESRVQKKYTYLDIFRYPTTRRRALIQFICWPVVSMVYYGISMNPSFMGGDRYVTFVLAALAEVPGILAAGFTINVLGRKILGILGFGLSGLLLGLTLVVPDSVVIAKMCLVTAAKMTITMEYAVQYTWSPELFPTVIRNQAMGLCSMFARIGGVAASYLIMYLAENYKTLVVLIFTGCSLGAAALSFLQPETAGSTLLETFEDAERFAKGVKIFSFRAASPSAPNYRDIPLGAYPKGGEDSEKLNPGSGDGQAQVNGDAGPDHVQA